MPRVGLVGIGDAGRHHARALALLESERRLEWAALCARDAAKLATYLAILDRIPPNGAA